MVRPFTYVLRLIRRVAQVWPWDSHAFRRPQPSDNAFSSSERNGVKLAEPIVDDAPFQTQLKPASDNRTLERSADQTSPNSALPLEGSIDALVTRRSLDQQSSEQPSPPPPPATSEFGLRRLESAERARATLIAERLRESLASLETRIPTQVLSVIHEIRRESLAVAEQSRAASLVDRREE